MLVHTCEEEIMFWHQAFGGLGFKNMKGLLQEFQRHMSYTMWKRCHKIIDESRSLTKGDMYFGWMIANWNDHLCQIKWNWPSVHLSAKNKKKIKEERLYFLNCLFSSTTLRTWAHHQVGGEHTFILQHSGHVYKVRRAFGVLEIQNKAKMPLLAVCLTLGRIKISLTVFNI